MLNTEITYPLLLIKSTAKRSFEELGRIFGRTGKTVKKLLMPHTISLMLLHKIAQYMFRDTKILTLSLDDTLIQKIYSKYMEGAGRFFDTKIYRKVTAYRLISSMITDGKFAIPLGFGFLFDKELLSGNEPIKSKLDFVKEFIILAQKLFPDKEIRVAGDGLFASIEFLKWCLENNIKADLRMHSNRKVEYKGRELKVKEIKALELKGRRMARLVQVKWHGLLLTITSEKRINKHGEESVVYIVSTYTILPSQHVKAYRRRWPIEKKYRTAKQYLGLGECFSTDLATQTNHVAAVFLGYAITQLEMKLLKLDNPEQAIKALKEKKLDFLINKFNRLGEIFGAI